MNSCVSSYNSNIELLKHKLYGFILCKDDKLVYFWLPTNAHNCQ